MKPKTSNAEEIRKLAGQVARTEPACKAFDEVVTAAESCPWNLRKGSSSTSARNGDVRVYASKEGEDERRIWVGDRVRSGYFAPLTGPKLRKLTEAIKSLP